MLKHQSSAYAVIGLHARGSWTRWGSAAGPLLGLPHCRSVERWLATVTVRTAAQRAFIPVHCLRRHFEHGQRRNPGGCLGFL